MRNKKKSHSISTKDHTQFGSLSRSRFSYPQRERYFPFGPVVGEEGFEPPTPWFVATCSNPLSYRPRLHWICSREYQEPFLSPFRVKKKRISLYKNGAFRGVKWERRDFIIGVLNKTTFSFFSFYY